MDLSHYNSTNYPLSIKKQLADAAYDESDELKYHQFLVKEFFTKNPKQRGILICHSMGQGKTRIAVAISTNYIEMDPRRKVIVLSAKSLSENYKKEVLLYTKQQDISANYKFVSLNSSNMFTTVKNLDKDPEEIALEKKFSNFVEDIGKNSLENSLLIIDEAHNLFNSITNGASNALALYDAIMRTRNIRLIFLSGTPVINHPFELAPCFNMLRGYMYQSMTPATSEKPDTVLFTEDIKEFSNFFIDIGEYNSYKIKNKDKFTNRIYGLVSYYGDLYFNDVSSREDFPKELDPIIERVPMTHTQFSKYIAARTTEIEETKKAQKQSSGGRFSASNGGSTTYRVKSRQISNFAIPEYALGPVRGMKSREKFIDKLAIEDLIQLDGSPKMAKILHNIEKHKGQQGMIYSQFVSGEGIGIFALVLKANGYVCYNELQDLSAYGLENKRKNTFAILSGDITPEERARIIVQFNLKDTPINLLLLSGAVAEGIDLKRIRHVHIMEPFWNYARINQVKTRAIRYKSHSDLPVEEQNVQTYIYLSDYPHNYPAKKITEKTTDVELYEKSITNMKLIDDFLLALAESSIDCAVHHDKLPEAVQKRIRCKLCAPDSKMLFHPMLSKDMQLPSNCLEYKESNVTVTPIELDGEKYFYKKVDYDIDIYYWDKKLMGYTALNQSNKAYDKLISHILEQVEQVEQVD